MNAMSQGLRDTSGGIRSRGKERKTITVGGEDRDYLTIREKGKKKKVLQRVGEGGTNLV